MNETSESSITLGETAAIGELAAAGAAVSWEAAAHKMRPRSRLVGIVLGKNTLALVDQVVVSGTRFLASIVIGRAGGPRELGEYSLGFTLFCIGACVLTALISAPFTIYGNYGDGDERRGYSGSVLAHFAIFELLVLAILGLATAIVALGDWRPGLVPLAGMLAITIPFAFVVEFARRFAVARLELTTALATDVIMSAIQVGGLLLLASLGQLSALTAFAAMGLAGAIAGLRWLANARRLFVIHHTRILADALRHWRFGRWALASQLMLMARSTAVLWMLALLINPSPTGIFVACDTLVRLSAPLLLAVTNVLFASVARTYAKRDISEVRRLSRQAAGVLGTATAILCLLFVWFGDIALTKLYGAAYSGQGAVVSLLALAMVADAFEIVATNSLMALDRSHLVFAANLVSTALTLTIAALLIPVWGVAGAAWASLLGRGLTAAVLWVAFLKITQGDMTSEVQV